MYFPTWNRLDGLLAGVLLAALAVYRPQTWARLARHGNAALLLGLGGLVLALWLFRDRVGLLGNSVGWPVLSAALACLVLAGASDTTCSGAGACRAPVRSPRSPTALYLSHKLVFHAVRGRAAGLAGLSRHRGFSSCTPSPRWPAALLLWRWNAVPGAARVARARAASATAIAARALA